ncbi:hypothetical protein L596_014408 [Steinernema carpocapsae]|uniref:Uncharacterized protein n=1 Tax=Steinernema carpocapsae TaxID=34508 RepID=A0A4U5NBV6_STECR|nr:hypothetical protein L596_014408 [Steinernema carpocapsae]
MEPILIAAILFGALLIALSIVGSFYIYRFTLNRERIHEKTGSSAGHPSIIACEEGKSMEIKKASSATLSINLPGQIPEAARGAGEGKRGHSCVNDETRALGHKPCSDSNPAVLPLPSNGLNAAQPDLSQRRKSSAALYELELMGIGSLPVDVQSEQEEQERQKRKNLMAA